MTNPTHNTSEQSSDRVRELGALRGRTMRDGALSRKTKELLALGIAVNARCDTSVAYHLHNALEAGATRNEIREAIEVAMVTAGEAAAVSGVQVLRALDEEGELAPPFTERPQVYPYMSPD